MFFTLFAVLALIVIDRISKIAACFVLTGKGLVEIIPGLLGFELLEGGNTGAAFGLFQGNAILLSVVTLVFLGVGLYLLIYKQFTNVLSKLSLLLIVAGGFGNLYDRVFYGAVTDFMKFLFIDFPYFNVADCFISVGAVLLVLSVLLLKKDEPFFVKKITAVDAVETNDKIDEKAEENTPGDDKGLDS